MGMEEEGKQLIADTEKLIQDKANKHPEIKGKKAAFVSLALRTYLNFTSTRQKILVVNSLLKLGMEYPESITSQMY